MRLLLTLLAASLAIPASAAAHVTLQPDEVEAGGFARLDVRVPNERDDSGTTKVDVQLPDGFYFVSYEAVAGWETKVTREKLPEPVEAAHGTEVTEQISRVTFTARDKDAVIAPGQFRDFGLSVGVPEGKAGDKLTFKAIQTYESGEVVRWIGAPDSDEPAPQVTLAAAAGGHAPAEQDAAAVPGPPPVQESADSDDGDSNGLAIAALIVGALGLLVGGAGFAMARGATRARSA